MYVGNKTASEIVREIYFDNNATEREKVFANKVDELIESNVDMSKEIASLHQKVAKLEQQIDA